MFIDELILNEYDRLNTNNFKKIHFTFKKKIQIIRDNTNPNNGIWLRGDLGKKSFSHKIGFYVTNDPIYGAAVAGASIPLGVTDIESVNSEVNIFSFEAFLL